MYGQENVYGENVYPMCMEKTDYGSTLILDFQNQELVNLFFVV